MRRALVLATAVVGLWLTPGAYAAGWCGSGAAAADRPDVVTGQQVHAVVALPSDAPDTFLADAARIADDSASMVSWWQGQDPTRVPRFDQASFGATSCLDLSFVRLPEPAAAYAGSGTNAFGRVSTQIGLAGLSDVYKKYLVYFDGAVVGQGLCGTGAGDFFSGPSYAIVWLNDCTDVPSDAIATHELLHAFGALPIGAPNFCHSSPVNGTADTGHPCDSTFDVLYPQAVPGRRLADQFLDVNHDDYYAHSGTWLDVQDSSWLHRLDLAQVGLSVALSGGPGEVQSDVPGIDCTAACATQWDQGAQVVLTALPAASDRFVRWSGACSGSSDCPLSLVSSHAVTAIFGPLRIAVAVTTAGQGRVTCTPKCGKRFAAGDPLTLRAVAAKGWRFAHWAGVCKGTHPTCRPSTNYALTARAVFTRRR